MYFSNGDKYQGKYSKGSRYGQGVLQYKDGSAYRGDWANDMISGKGTLEFSNGDRYEGEFLSGEKHGKGVYQYATGDRYEGNWKASRMSGYGVMQFVNGDVFEGEWENGQKITGQYISQNGETFKGDFPQSNALMQQRPFQSQRNSQYERAMNMVQ